jgi:hypothetical protein
VYAVRTGAGVELARVRWNGAVMLLEAAPGRSDFEVIEAPGETGRIARLLGSVVRVLDP